MSMGEKRQHIFIILIGALIVTSIACGDDSNSSWPQFHGPNRDNLSTETGLLKKWPENGPALLWTARGLGHGYSTVSIAAGMIYTAGSIEKDTVITALNMDGKTQWQVKNGPAWTGDRPGTRGTPTIDGNRLYDQSPIGNLVCLDAKTGKKIWGFNTLEKFKSKTNTWALAESLLVDGERLICCPGGPQTSMVALNKNTGSVIWTSPSVGDLAGYSSPTLADYQGLRIIMVLTAKNFIGVNADTGEMLWQVKHESYADENVMTPIFHDGQVFISTLKTGSVKFKINVKDGKVSLEELWRTEELDCHHGGVLLLDGNLHGNSTFRNSNLWICLDWQTGAKKYMDKGVGKGSLTYADGMLYTLSENGVMGLVRPAAAGYELVSSFDIPKGGQGNSWAHPVVCAGRLYLRHGDFLYAYSIGSKLPAAQDRAQLANSAIPKLEKVLQENIAKFWYDKSLDRVNGGYTINFGPKGELKGPGTKMIVTQARTIWLFARLARAGYDGDKNIEAAEHGYRFLKEKMWDAENGGFYWEVDATGNEKLKAQKHLYGQSFALYAISEYYLATQRQDVLDFAIRLFDLLEEKSHDKKFGGYIEFFNEDWTPVPDGESSYMGAPAGMKLMNTHLHLMEAMTTFYRAGKLPLARERLLELIDIESNAVVRKNLGACTDKYDRDWTPRLEAGYAQVSYGHDIENIWLLMDACDAAGISNYPFADLYRTLFDYSYKYGYDQGAGGFYYTGLFNQPADVLTKVWWVEAEAVVSALYMHRLTGDPQYLDIFEQTYDYIEKHLVDWEYGEWHANITARGAVQGDKANTWKAGYHSGRSMIECLEILKQWKN